MSMHYCPLIAESPAKEKPLSPSDATASSPRVVWVAISNINGCALLVEDGDQSDHQWPGVTWKRFVEENSELNPQ